MPTERVAGAPWPRPAARVRWARAARLPRHTALPGPHHPLARARQAGSKPPGRGGQAPRLPSVLTRALGALESLPGPPQGPPLPTQSPFVPSPWRWGGQPSPHSPALPGEALRGWLQGGPDVPCSTGPCPLRLPGRCCSRPGATVAPAHTPSPLSLQAPARPETDNPSGWPTLWPRPTLDPSFPRPSKLWNFFPNSRTSWRDLQVHLVRPPHHLRETEAPTSSGAWLGGARTAGQSRTPARALNPAGRFPPRMATTRVGSRAGTTEGRGTAQIPERRRSRGAGKPGRPCAGRDVWEGGGSPTPRGDSPGRPPDGRGDRGQDCTLFPAWRGAGWPDPTDPARPGVGPGLGNYGGQAPR